MLPIKYGQCQRQSTQFSHADLNCRPVIAQLVARPSGETFIPLFKTSLLTYHSYNCGGELSITLDCQAHETDSITQL